MKGNRAFKRQPRMIDDIEEVFNPVQRLDSLFKFPYFTFFLIVPSAQKRFYSPQSINPSKNIVYFPMF